MLIHNHLDIFDKQIGDILIKVAENEGKYE